MEIYSNGQTLKAPTWSDSISSLKKFTLLLMIKCLSICKSNGFLLKAKTKRNFGPEFSKKHTLNYTLVTEISSKESVIEFCPSLLEVFLSKLFSKPIKIIRMVYGQKLCRENKMVISWLVVRLLTHKET
jgi:hypothetical protein